MEGHRTLFRIDIYDRKTRRYRTLWTGPESFALTMFNKPYTRRSTRRLVRVDETTTHYAKGSARK